MKGRVSCESMAPFSNKYVEFMNKFEEADEANISSFGFDMEYDENEKSENNKNNSKVY